MPSHYRAQQTGLTVISSSTIEIYSNDGLTIFHPDWFGKYRCCNDTGAVARYRALVNADAIACEANRRQRVSRSGSRDGTTLKVTINAHLTSNLIQN